MFCVQINKTQLSASRLLWLDSSCWPIAQLCYRPSLAGSWCYWEESGSQVNRSQVDPSGEATGREGRWGRDEENWHREMERRRRGGYRETEKRGERWMERRGNAFSTRVWPCVYTALCAVDCGVFYVKCHHTNATRFYIIENKHLKWCQWLE